MDKKGFTLIELLVVMVILAILAIVGTVIFSDLHMAANDTKRKQDLKDIAFALEKYYLANHSFPATPDGEIGEVGFTSADSQPWIPGLTPNYIEQLPVDPVNIYLGQTDPGTRIYGYVSNNPTDYTCPQSEHPWFILATILERPNDKENLANKPFTKWCDDVTYAIDTEYGPAASLAFIIIVRK